MRPGKPLPDELMCRHVHTGSERMPAIAGTLRVGPQIRIPRPHVSPHTDRAQARPAELPALHLQTLPPAACTGKSGVLGTFQVMRGPDPQHAQPRPSAQVPPECGMGHPSTISPCFLIQLSPAASAALLPSCCFSEQIHL